MRKVFVELFKLNARWGLFKIDDTDIDGFYFSLWFLNEKLHQFPRNQYRNL
jgi:hypothetical protein